LAGPVLGAESANKRAGGNCQSQNAGPGSFRERSLGRVPGEKNCVTHLSLLLIELFDERNMCAPARKDFQKSLIFALDLPVIHFRTAEVL
jgi:hypothetical protein